MELPEASMISGGETVFLKGLFHGESRLVVRVVEYDVEVPFRCESEDLICHGEGFP